jgi:GT2 family glycosyltransferase
MARPAVDLVIPFAGSSQALAALAEQLRRIHLGPKDTLLIVDNNAEPCPVPPDPPAVLHAPGRPTPAYARNRGAERGGAPWIVFLDADVVPPPDLLDRLFDPAPGARTGLLAGGMADAAVAADGPPAARYAYIRELMSQDDSLQFGSWGFPKMANAAVRRQAFESVGGFSDQIRAGEDADLTYRLEAAGWGLERREGATVVHESRQTVRGFVGQKAVHGAGAAWLADRYPGVFPARRRPGLVWWGLRTAGRGLFQAARRRDRDRALWAVFEPLEQLAFEFGRSLSNERPPRGVNTSGR